MKVLNALANKIMARPTTAAVKAMFDIATLLSFPPESMRIRPAMITQMTNTVAPRPWSKICMLFRKSVNSFIVLCFPFWKRISSPQKYAYSLRATLRQCQIRFNSDDLGVAYSDRTSHLPNRNKVAQNLPGEIPGPPFDYYPIGFDIITRFIDFFPLSGQCRD